MRIEKNVKTGEETSFPDAPGGVDPAPLTVQERQDAIDLALDASEPLRLILEAVEDAQGLARGQLRAAAKGKVQ